MILAQPQYEDARPATLERQAEDGLRAAVYGLLASLLVAPPSALLLQSLRDIEPGEGGFAPAWALLRLAARRSTPQLADDEYHDLFIGVARGELVPYGSWYMTGFLMDRPLAALRNDLRRLGFERQDDVHEPEDHAAALLEVMSRLADPEEGLSADEQRRFFEAHIAPWMERFFGDLETANHGRLYAAVGGLGRQFIDFERNWLSMPDGE